MSGHTTQLASLKSRRALLACMAGLWILALIPGVRYLLRFETATGKQGIAPSGWNSSVLPSGNPHLPTLLVVLHPKCSCSNATLTELEEAAQTFHTPYNAILLVDPPQGSTFDWQKISSYREAQKALHAAVVLDAGGNLAADFGAFTSGDVLLYSAEDVHARRSLLFSGGVTGGRGMVGENRGVEALEAAFHNPGSNSRFSSPVFGCGLLSTATIAKGNKQ